MLDRVGNDTGRTSGADLFQLPGGLTQGRITRRRELMKQFDQLRSDLDQNGSMESVDSYSQQAAEMVIGRRAQEAKDIVEKVPELECTIQQPRVIAALLT